MDNTIVRPLKLTSERAWRTYLGGKLLDRLHGKPDGGDGRFPEEWIMSLVSARNAGRENIVEGLSRLADEPSVTLKSLVEAHPAEMLGKAHAEKHGPSAGVLVKLIDSSERLTVQVHPTRAKARELFGSPYGKTECWHILGGREINGSSPCVYLGFKPGVSRARWRELFERQDIPAMLDCLHRFDVYPGETILLEGGVPHAIGAGCFLVEIQEPTDYTIRVERTTPSGFQVDDFMCHQGLGFERMFDCFEYAAFTQEETRRRWFIAPRPLSRDASGSITTLLGYETTPFFRLDLVEVQKEAEIAPQEVFFGVYALEGRGSLAGAG
ncbi:MAG: class I mannose-6-phosphate isomerase, partial [Spirochaetia bacterium]|nr:class I mannose-6-phosphate isomerase [Spirochaetia bacterium]